MTEQRGRIHIGTAGWQIRREHDAHFDSGSSVLARYATRLCGVEINSSFYRPHRPQTYARWASAVPSSFRFAVKLPRTITHERRLCDCRDLLERFLGEAGALGDRLGPLLVQLPPTLAFDPTVVAAFFALLRAHYSGPATCEPRHPSWFTRTAEILLRDWKIARAVADPPPAPGAERPGGWDGLVYYRLHGSPHMYYSNYERAVLTPLAAKLAAATERGCDVWCIFDNTARGAATANALEMLERAGALRRF